MTNADQTADNAGGNDRTFRFLVTPTIDGTQERVQFSNVYGKSAVTIGAARLAVGKDGSPKIDATRDQQLSFGGQPSTVLQAGATLLSDPVKLSFNFGETLAVTVYLKGSFGLVARHDSLFITNYAGEPGSGDLTTDIAGTGMQHNVGDWLLVNRIDVYGQYQGTFALFGSSTTDGYKSNYSSDHIYPDPNVPVAGQHTSRMSDHLARRLNAAGYRIGVVNLGIPGDSVTVDSTNAAGDVLNANDRVAQDVFPVPNLLGAMTYFGSIDLRSADCKSAPAIIAATQKLIATAHTAGVPLYVATLPPTGLCSNPAQANFGPLPTPTDPYAGAAGSAAPNGAEIQRLAFNQWVRTTAVNSSGVAMIADFDATLTDPNHPSFMLPQYNAGDNFHMNGNGYMAEANSIPLDLLPKP